MWTRFMDMYTGGTQKTEWDYIYIEADKGADAEDIFEEKFGIHPYGSACSCCGEDYSVYEVDAAEVGVGDNALVIPAVTPEGPNNDKD